MLRVSIDAEMVDENGDMTWFELKLSPSDDPGKDYIDFAIPTPCGEGDNILIDTVDLKRALRIIAAERKIEVASE